MNNLPEFKTPPFEQIPRNAYFNVTHSDFQVPSLQQDLLVLHRYIKRRQPNVITSFSSSVWPTSANYNRLSLELALHMQPSLDESYCLDLVVHENQDGDAVFSPNNLSYLLSELDDLDPNDFIDNYHKGDDDY